MKQNGPWKTLNSEIKYKNPWIEVSEDKVIQPDGKPGIYGVIKGKSGVYVAALDAEQNIYLTREYKYVLKRYSLEVCTGGRLNDKEPYLDAAKRELKEELGITARKWIDLGMAETNSGLIDLPDNLFLAIDLKFGEQKLDDSEDIEIIKLPFVEAVEMAYDGRIDEAQSALTILRAKMYLDRQNRA